MILILPPLAPKEVGIWDLVCTQSFCPSVPHPHPILPHSCPPLSSHFEVRKWGDERGAFTAFSLELNVDIKNIEVKIENLEIAYLTNQKHCI